jgi:hypothetical protein
MKPRLLIISFCSLSLFATAQSSKTASSDVGLSTLRKQTIRLNDPHDPLPPSSPDAFRPFSYFEVIDDRPDTTRIGVHGNLPMNGHQFDRQLTFPNPAAQEVARYLNRYFTHPDAPDTALVVLRQLWLSDTDPYLPAADPNRTAGQEQQAGKTHIRMRAEVYARRDNRYLPLIRIDTLQATANVTYSTVKCTYNGWEKELVVLFRELTENAALALAQKESAGRWITWDDIHRFNQSRFTIALFNSPTLRRGVYASFEEFRDNAPSIRDFEIRKDIGGFAIYLKAGDGTSYYSHIVWGCCDGKQVFLMRDGLLTPLRKVGNSFCFYGIEPDGLAPAPGSFGGHNERRCLYIIDMDTGAIY